MENIGFIILVIMSILSWKKVLNTWKEHENKIKKIKENWE